VFFCVGERERERESNDNIVFVFPPNDSTF